MGSSSDAKYSLFVGIDVAAKTLSAAFIDGTRPPSRSLSYHQTPAGYRALQEQLIATGHTPQTTLVVMEATGTYWVTLAITLVEAGYRVSVINAAQAHAFAKALLKRAKTDAIDAQTLAHLAAKLQPESWTPPPAVYTQLQQRLVHRDALVTMRTELSNQLHALVQHPVVVARVRARLERLIDELSKEVKAVEQEIAEVVNEDEQWAAAARRLQTSGGIGLRTATWLLTATVKFTLCETAEQAAADAGLAPSAYQSGTSVRGRATIGRGGNARLRRVLYLATLSATRYNPSIKRFYERLRAAGKPPKVARCAAARKLLHIAWAVVTKEQDFDASRGQAVGVVEEQK
jgi:transposase